MPDRSVAYRFLGNFSNLTAGLATAGRNVTELGVKMTALDRNGAKMRAGLTQLGSTGGKVGLVFAAGVAIAVRAAANFEQGMSNVQAATHETAENMELLRSAAIEAGQATKFSATEAAQAVEELAKAGVSTGDILGGGLKGSMDLAAAGGLEVADAAQIAATALTQFKLKGEDVPHVADLLAAGAGKAQGDVSDLSMALKQSGLVASQMGVSIEETTGTLAAFASAGLLGSDAGTSFRTMLLRLANPTLESSKLMKQLGIEAYDAQGNFVGIESLAGQLQTAFQGQTQATRDAALATIFGSDAIRAATVLYTDGAQGVADWTDKVNDQGYAAETAAIKMDNLNGDLEQLRGSLETALIGVGGGSQGPLRTLVQGITDTVNAFNELPGPVKTATLAAAGFVAVFGGGTFLTSRVISGLSTTRQALENVGVSAETAAKTTSRLGKAMGAAAGLSTFAVGLQNDNKLLGTFETTLGLAAAGLSVGGPWGAAVGGAIGLVVGLGKSHDDTKAKVADLTSTFDQQTGAITENTRVKIANQLQTDGLLDAAQQLGIENSVLTDAVMGNAAAQESLNAALAGYDVDHTVTSAEDLKRSFSDQEIAAILADRAATKLRDGIPGLSDNFSQASADAQQLASAYAETGATADGASGATGMYASVTGEAGTAAEQAAADIAEMVKAMQDQKDAAVGAFDAITNYRQAMKDAAAQAKKSEAGIKGNSDEALANRDALSQLIGAWNGLDQTVTDNVGKFKEARDNFIKTATGMGVSKDAATKLWQEMAKIPSSKVIPVTVQAGGALATLAAIKGRMDQIKDKTVHINVVTGPHAGGQTATDEQVPNDKHPRTAGRSSGDDSLSRSIGDRLRRSGLDTVAPRTGQLNRQAEEKAAYALQLLAKESDDAGKGTKGLKHRLLELEDRLTKASKAADAAHDALNSLKDQKAGLSSSVSQALTHDPFGGSLEDFVAQTSADKADAEALLQALQTLVGNGLDPTSPLFQQLAASGNVALAQQFAALSRESLAAQAFSYASTQGSLNQVGQFAGSQAFDAAINAQAKVSDRLDGTVKALHHQVNHLEHVLDKLGDQVKKGAQDGTKDLGDQVYVAMKEGFTDRGRRTSSTVRTGGGSR